jgi:hypothetical protein
VKLNVVVVTNGNPSSAMPDQIRFSGEARGLADHEVYFRCVCSLIHSLNRFARRSPAAEVALWILDRHPSQIRWDITHNILQAYCAYPARILKPDLPALDFALSRGPGFLYMTESDHLHDPDGISELMSEAASFRARFGRDVALLPFVPESLPSEPARACIHLGQRRYWITRQSGSNGSFFARIEEPGSHAARTEVLAAHPAISLPLRPEHVPTPRLGWENWWNETRSMLG